MTSITIEGSYNDSNLVLNSASSTITENSSGPAGPAGPAGSVGPAGPTGAPAPSTWDSNSEKVLTDYYQISFGADASGVETKHVYAMNLIDGLGQINYNGNTAGIQSAVKLAELKAAKDPKAEFQVTYAKRNAFLLNQGSSGHSTHVHKYDYSFNSLTNSLHYEKQFRNIVTPNSGHAGEDTLFSSHDAYDCRWDLKNMRYSADYLDLSLVSASFPNGRYQYSLTTNSNEVNVNETPDGVTLPMPSYTYISKDPFSEDLAINELDKFAKQRNYITKPNKSRIQQMLDDRYFSQVLSEKITAICKADSSDLSSLSGRPAPFNVLASNPKVTHKDHSSNTLVEEELFSVYREADVSYNHYIKEYLANMNEILTGKYIVKYSENCLGSAILSQVYMKNYEFSAAYDAAVLRGDICANLITGISENLLADGSFQNTLKLMSKVYKAEVDLGLDYINRPEYVNTWEINNNVADASYSGYAWDLSSVLEWISEFENSVAGLHNKYTQAWQDDISGGIEAYLIFLGAIHLRKV